MKISCKENNSFYIEKEKKREDINNWNIWYVFIFFQFSFCWFRLQFTTCSSFWYIEKITKLDLYFISKPKISFNQLGNLLFLGPITSYVCDYSADKHNTWDSVIQDNRQDMFVGIFDTSGVLKCKPLSLLKQVVALYLDFTLWCCRKRILSKHLKNKITTFNCDSVSMFQFEIRNNNFCIVFKCFEYEKIIVPILQINFILFYIL